MGMRRRDAFMHFAPRQKQRAGPKSRADTATGLFLAFCAQLLQALRDRALSLRGRLCVRAGALVTLGHCGISFRTAARIAKDNDPLQIGDTGSLPSTFRCAVDGHECLFRFAGDGQFVCLLHSVGIAHAATSRQYSCHHRCKKHLSDTG
jgi:crotonobetainyl-CoA:carnitine CoA-transferase CaiB-like acyl-CoA transferase